MEAETEIRFVGVDGGYFFRNLKGMASREAIPFFSDRFSGYRNRVDGLQNAFFRSAENEKSFG